MSMTIKGLTQVCRKVKFFHLFKYVRAFLRFDTRIDLVCEARGWRDELCDSGMGVVGGLDNGDDGVVGLRSNVDSADAPVSPLRSDPKLLDFRRGLGMFSLVRGFPGDLG